jgi:hypothetical protein
MLVDERNRLCLKCDAVWSDQTDGSIVTIDIAHHGERVRDALAKLKTALRMAKQDYTLAIRVVVGHGLIRDAITSQLNSWLRSRQIRSFATEGNNRGVFMVFLRTQHY